MFRHLLALRIVRRHLRAQLSHLDRQRERAEARRQVARTLALAVAA